MGKFLLGDRAVPINPRYGGFQGHDGCGVREDVNAGKAVGGKCSGLGQGDLAGMGWCACRCSAAKAGGGGEGGIRGDVEGMDSGVMG